MRECSTIVLFSGGIDSLLCGMIAAKDDKQFTTLTIDYGQERAEIYAACWLAERFKWSRTVVRATPFPASLDPAGTNYVPGRNSLFLSLAAALLPVDGGKIYIGANQDDKADYPDCRLEYFTAFEHLFDLQGIHVAIKHPLIDMTKAEVIKEAHRRDAPFDMTVSCYRGSPPCVRCNACKLRAKAFAETGISDPRSPRSST